jgi:hypothetical protein
MGLGMSISIAVGGRDGSERIVSTNLKSVEVAERKAADIAERLSHSPAPAETAPVCVRIYAGATVHRSLKVAAAA